MTIIFRKIDSLSLGRSNDRLELLAFVRNDEPVVRQSALRALSKKKNPQLTVALELCMRDRDSLVRMEAFEIIERHPGYSQFESQIIRGLADRSNLVRSYAVRALAAVKGRVAFKRLRQFSRTATKWSKISAEAALYEIESRKVRIAKIASYLDSSDYHLRCAAANALIHIANKSNADEVIRRFKKALNTEKTIAVTSTIQSGLKKITRTLHRR